MEGLKSFQIYKNNNNIDNLLKTNHQYSISTVKFSAKSTKNPSTVDILGSTLLGFGIINVTMKGSGYFVVSKIKKEFKNLNKTVTSNELKDLKTAVETVMKTSGLKDKEVIFLTDEECEKFVQRQEKKLAKSSFFKKILCKKAVKQLRRNLNGENACFMFPNKHRSINNSGGKIFCTDNIKLASFHEMGHAMDFNFGKFTKKLLLSRRYCMYTRLALPFVALLKTKKQENEKPVGILDKTTTFIKENIGKLLFAVSLPIILEEGIASLKGEKSVKNLLNEKLFKKVVKNNRLGLSSYILSTLFFSVSVSLGVKVKDIVLSKCQKISDSQKTPIHHKIY